MQRHVARNITFQRITTLAAAGTTNDAVTSIRIATAASRLAARAFGIRRFSDLAATSTMERDPTSAVAASNQSVGPPKAASAAAASVTSESASGSASAAVAPSDTLLSSSILLRRLAERHFTQQQVRRMVQHLINTHAVSTHTAGAAAPSAESAGAPALAAPLTRAAYEVMLSALQEVQDIDTFDEVWSRMHTQFAPSSSSSSSAAAATASSFHPSALMYLCRMSVLMAHRRLELVEDTFRSWKRSSEITADLPPSTPASQRTTPPNLLAFHLMLRRHLLAAEKTGDSDGDPECAAKCMRLLQELKAAGSGTAVFDGQDDEEESAAPNPASSASLLPVHLTFHLLLQSLLPRAMRDLRHLTPLLLDMEHQAGLAPDWNTFALAIQVCHRAAQQAQQIASQPISPAASKMAVKAAERQRSEATMQLQTAWAKGAQLFRSVQQHAEKTRKLAEKKRADLIAKQKADAAKSSEGSPPAHLPPSPPPVPVASALIPPGLWFKYLELSLESGEHDSFLTALATMQREAMLIPPPALVEPIMRACVAIAAMPAPPAPVFSDDARMDEEDKAIAMRTWTQKARAHQALQQRALAATLQMLRCSATHARMAADAEARRAAARPTPPTATDATAASPASPVDPSAPTSAAPATTGAPAAVIPMAHFVFAFEVLSRLGRVDEFAKLWRHFMAQQPPLPAATAGTAGTAAESAPSSTVSTAASPSVSPVDELVRSALRLDAAAVAEAASAQSDRAAAVAAVAAVQVTSTGGEMAYSICSFFAKQMAAAAAAVSAPSAAVPAAADAPPSDAPATDSVHSSSAPSVASSVEGATAAPLAAPVDLVPVLTLLAPSTRAALVASLLAGDLTEEFTHVFAAQKHFLPLTQQRKQREQ